MMTPRSSSSGSFFAMCAAASRLMLKVAIRFRSITDWKDSRSCGPDLVSVRLAMPPPAVVTIDVQAAELVDRGLQRLFGAGEVGDVNRVERTAEALGNLLTVGTFAVENGDIGTALGEQFRGGASHPRCAADDDGLLPVDLHPDLSFSGCQIPCNL